MAERELIVSDLLCFLLSKYGHMSSITLKSVVKESYSVQAFVAAKELLLTELNKLNLSFKLPTLARRQAGPNQLQAVVDDMFTLLVFIDEKDLRGKLPKFVCENIENIPNIRLLDGDLKFLLNAIMNLEASMGNLYAKVGSMSSVSTRLDIVATRLDAIYHNISAPAVLPLATASINQSINQL